MSLILPDDFYQEAANKCVEYADKLPPAVARGLAGTVVEEACKAHSSLLVKQLEHLRQSHIELHDENLAQNEELIELRGSLRAVAKIADKYLTDLENVVEGLDDQEADQLKEARAAIDAALSAQPPAKSEGEKPV